MLKSRLQKAIEGILGQEVKLEHPGDLAHGDFSTNVALVGDSKKGLGPSIDPIQTAEQLAGKLRPSSEISKLVEKIEVAPPGFINFWLSKAALVGQLSRALETAERYGSSQVGQGRTMVVDFSHPNIAKRFGIGHLRSTIIGWAIINLYRNLGWKVIADNFLGDWGTQFGMIIAQIKNKKLDADKLTLDDFVELYVEFNKMVSENPDLQEKARFWFKKLEDGDGEVRKIWEIIKNKSLVEFERIWKLLDVEFDYIHGESFFEDKIAGVIADAKERGAAQESDGALVVDIPGFDVPLMLLKSDGATTYETRDLAAISYWGREFKPEKIVYEVGTEQSLHFKQVFKVAEMLRLAKKGQLLHVKHGLYLSSETRKKLSTRKGEIVELEKVLDQAVDKAKELIKGKNRSVEVDKLSREIGVGAVKYFDLSHHHESDIVFDWNKIFAMEGNSGPYLQYTYARTQSVLEKATTDYRLKTTALDGSRWTVDANSEELTILREFYKFPEVVREAAGNFSPNLLCNFLFELSQKYNNFYNVHRIIGSENESFRLALTKVVGSILKIGLGLLGIAAPEKM